MNSNAVTSIIHRRKRIVTLRSRRRQRSISQPRLMVTTVTRLPAPCAGDRAGEDSYWSDRQGHRKRWRLRSRAEERPEQTPRSLLLSVRQVSVQERTFLPGKNMSALLARIRGWQHINRSGFSNTLISLMSYEKETKSF